MRASRVALLAARPTRKESFHELIPGRDLDRPDYPHRDQPAGRISLRHAGDLEPDASFAAVRVRDRPRISAVLLVQRSRRARRAGPLRLPSGREEARERHRSGPSGSRGETYRARHAPDPGRGGDPPGECEALLEPTIHEATR